MYCSGCGTVINPGQGFCPQCGRAAAAPVPPVPTMAFEVEQYGIKIQTLGTMWILYAGLVLLTSIGGIWFAHSFFSGGFPWSGPWGRGPWGHGAAPFFLAPAFLHMLWVFTLARVALLVAAGWGLREHASWGRPVAIIAAFFSLIRIPLGTGLGIWSLVMLLGYRNRSLYEQL